MGRGLNISEKDGKLDTHINGNYNDELGLNRRLNSIIYLAKNWKNYGGELGIYSKNGSKLIKLIEPKFNRLIIINTNDDSYHGIPNEINFPKNKSLFINSIFFKIGFIIYFLKEINFL